MASGISPIARLRIYAVRALIFASVLDVAEYIRLVIYFKNADPPAYTESIWLPLVVVIAVHHILAVIEWRFMYNALDFTIFSAEVTGMVYGFRRDYYRSVIVSLPIAFSPKVVLLSMLCLDRLFMAFNGLRKSWRYIVKPVRLVPKQEKHLWGSRWKILGGRHLLSSHLLGETARVIVPRFILGYIALFLVLGYSYFVVIERPNQADQVWTKQMTIWASETKKVGDLFGSRPLSLYIWQGPLDCSHDPLWFENEGLSVAYMNSGNLAQAPSCDIPSHNILLLEENICQHYVCPFTPTAAWLASPENSEWTTPFTIMPGRNVTIPPMIPTIVVEYNFSKALGSRDEVDITFVMSHYAANTTTPIRLTRGGHDVVSYTLDFWEELDFGSFPSFWQLLNPDRRRYPVIKEVSRSPDTARNVSAFGPNIGSIRLTRTPQGMMTLYQQVTKSDVFDSVASIGGLWTLLNGIFLIICGRGLLDVLIGQRPLSAVGWLHVFDRKRIQAAAKENYPHIPDDRAAGGLPAVIADHFVDMDPFETADKASHLAPDRDTKFDAERCGEKERDKEDDSQLGMLEPSGSSTHLPRVVSK